MDFGKKLFKGFILCYNESNAYKMGWTMIDEERVKQMTKMAIYEEGEGKQYVPMTQYFRHDYVGKEMVKSVILGTFAFALFGNYSRNIVDWKLSNKLFEVATNAVSDDRNKRYQSINEFRKVWDNYEK